MNKMIMLEPKEPPELKEPNPPEQYIEQLHEINFINFGKMSMNELISHLPKGVSSDDLRFEYDDDASAYSKVYNIYYVVKEKNINYKSQYRAYEKAKREFEKIKALHIEEVEKFKVDVKEFLSWARKEKHYYDVIYYKTLKKKYNIK